MSAEPLPSQEVLSSGGREPDKAATTAVLGVVERVMRAITRDYGLQNTFELITSELEVIVPHDCAALFSWQEDYQNLRVEAVAPAERQYLEIGMSLPPSAPLIELAQGRLEAAICSDTRYSPDWWERELANGGIFSCITLPLNTEGTYKKLLNLGSFNINQYGAEQIARLRELVGPIETNLAQYWDQKQIEGMTRPLRSADGYTREQHRLVAELAGGVAHSLNNIFATLLGNIQLLAEEIKNKDVEERLQRMEEAVGRGTSTMRALEQFSSSGAAKNLEVLQLDEVVGEVIALTQPVWKQLRTAGAEIAVKHHRQEGITVRANRAEIKEALINIVFNAIQALPEGGQIEISEGYQEHRAYVRVADNGVGMSREVRRRATEPFFTTRSNTSPGLGLSVASGIARRHGGDVHIFSEPGEGATVVMEIGILGEREATAA